MVVNFKARGISRGMLKLARTPTLNYKKKNRNRVLYLQNNHKHDGSKHRRRSCPEKGLALCMVGLTLEAFSNGKGLVKKWWA
jgi:hypothetical protein